MSDEQKTAEPQQEEAKLEERVGRIENAVESILTALHGGSQKAVETKLDAPGSVAEEVQRELARRDQKAAEDRKDLDLKSLKETVAKLTEKKPESPPRKVEQLMGWH